MPLKRRNRSRKNDSGVKSVQPAASVFERATEAIQDSLERNRGGLHRNNTLVKPGGSDRSVSPAATGTFRRERTGKGDSMVVPEGVVIEGSLNAEADAEISGRVLGNVQVGRKLRLGPAGVIVGNVRCQYGQIEGVIEGKTDCNETLDLGPTGKLNSDVMSGAATIFAGEVHGDVKCGNTLRLTATAIVTGNLRARAMAMESGAIFNGLCSTRDPETDAPKR